MLGTPAIRNLIRENKVAQMYSIIQTGQAFGMQTLDQNLADLVRGVSRRPGPRQAPAREIFPGGSDGAFYRSLGPRKDRWNATRRQKFINDLLHAGQREKVGPVPHLQASAGHQVDSKILGPPQSVLRPAHPGAGRSVMNDKRGCGIVQGAPRSATSPSRLRASGASGSNVLHAAGPGRHGVPHHQHIARPGRARTPHPRTTRHDQTGLVIFVGGTGTGKTTSLAALVTTATRNGLRHIITIEIPLGSLHPTTQELHRHPTGGGVDTRRAGDRPSEEHPWPGAGRHPHGEIRDRETMDYAAFTRNWPPLPSPPARQQFQPGVGPDHQLLPGRAARPVADGPS